MVADQGQRADPRLQGNLNGQEPHWQLWMSYQLIVVHELRPWALSEYEQYGQHRGITKLKSQFLDHLRRHQKTHHSHGHQQNEYGIEWHV